MPIRSRRSAGFARGRTRLEIDHGDRIEPEGGSHVRGLLACTALQAPSLERREPGIGEQFHRGVQNHRKELDSVNLPACGSAPKTGRIGQEFRIAADRGTGSYGAATNLLPALL